MAKSTTTTPAEEAQTETVVPGELNVFVNQEELAPGEQPHKDYPASTEYQKEIFGVNLNAAEAPNADAAQTVKAGADWFTAPDGSYIRMDNIARVRHGKDGKALGSWLQLTYSNGGTDSIQFESVDAAAAALKKLVGK